MQIREKKFKTANSQSPPENQLKRHVLVWVITTLLIKWKVNFREFPCRLWGRNSLHWHQNIQIKFSNNFLIKFRTFLCQCHILYANESRKIRNHKKKTSLSEMCPNTEFFLVHVYPHLECIRRDTSYLSVFTPNAGKYGPEKTPYLDSFHTVYQEQISNVLELHLMMTSSGKIRMGLKQQQRGSIWSPICDPLDLGSYIIN